MIKVSVVIPTYRRSKFIKRAIDSVIQQENVETEIIVVDDNGRGSKYQIENEEVLSDYINSKRIIYVAHDINKNGSAARNTGIKNASGDFISFLDDDDWFEPRKLYNQILLMEEEKTDACLCGFIRVYKNGNMPTSIPYFDDSWKKRLLAFNIDTCAGSCLTIRRGLIDKVGLFDTSFIRHQDIEFLYRISKYTNISVVKESLVNIFMHIENTRTKSGKNIETYRLHFIDTFKDDILRMKIADKKFVIDKHYKEIAKAYIKNKDIFNALKWIFKTSNPFYVVWDIYKDSMKYVSKKKIANTTK